MTDVSVEQVDIFCIISNLYLTVCLLVSVMTDKTVDQTDFDRGLTSGAW